MTSLQPDRTRRRSVRRVAGPVLVIALLGVLAACVGPTAQTPTSPAAVTSSASATLSDSSSSAAPTAAATESGSPRVARIGVLASLSGGSGAAGRGLRNAVELAVREANEDHAVPGWRFEVVAVDDRGSQSAGQRVASMLAGTDGMVGVVGSMRSAVDEGVQPILNSAGIAMLSPGATSGQLTRRTAASGDVRPFPSYFRLAPREDQEGAAAARYAWRDLGARRVAVVDDGSAYGRMVARDFVAALQGTSVEVVRRRSVDATDATTVEAQQALRRAATSIAKADRRRGVDVVLYGGDADAAGVLGEALHARDVGAPLLGGDGLFVPRFVAPEGRSRPGDLALFAGVPVSEARAAGRFAERYADAGFAEPAGEYGPVGYDAASAIVTAFGDVVAGRDLVGPSLRADVVDALDAIRFRGASGPVSFDDFGDRETARYTVHRVALGAWRPVGSVRAD